MGLFLFTAVDLFRVAFLCDNDSATPVFPKMLKIGQTGVFGLSDPGVI